ncbi:MAG TPA: gamma-glutamyltransferase [Actinomycetota bacterium]
MELSAAGERWALATPHALATEAGAVAFERGGNALDAALAAAVTLAVVYPHMCGVGGDLFALIQRPDGQTVALNASGRAPARLDVDRIRARHREMPSRGPDVITVPGAVSGWDVLHREGALLPWADAFTPAIAYAHGGVAVSRSLAGTLDELSGEIAADPGLAAIFRAGGRPLAAGEPFVQPALGATLQTVAAYGPAAVYGGEVGRRLTDGLATLGSALAPADLEAHRADLVPPLVGRFGDLDVRVAPPNSQGFVLLQILALVERLGIDPDPAGPEAGTLALIASAAGRDRDRHLADADAMAVHPSTLLDDGHLAALADEVRARDAATAAARGDTIALVAADVQGWAVSLIQSLAAGFGSGICEPATGIVLQNRGAGFTLDPEHPNVLAPGKRPAHTLMPVLVHRGDRLAAAAGTMGGYAQPQINAQNLLRVSAANRSAVEVLAAPRWLVGGMDVEGDPPFVVAEEGLPVAAAEAIARAGYRLDRVAAPSEDVGHAHLILVRPDGSFDVASDPRADGGAMAS